MNTSTPHRAAAEFAAFEQLDSRLRRWALDEGGDERSFPVLIAAETLRRAEYPDAFPHLLMAPTVAADPAQPFEQGNTALADWFLSPAVCYHAYAQFAGRTLDCGETLTARGHCFRNEDSAALAPGRRQIEFEMRELRACRTFHLRRVWLKAVHGRPLHQHRSPDHLAPAAGPARLGRGG